MFKLIKSLFGAKKIYKIQSFTYFIPSPPPRSTGYREKQFDKIFHEFINRGYTILNFTAQASTGEKQSGMWLVFIVQAQNEAADALKIDEILQDSVKSKISVKESIDGFYYIDDRSQEND